MKTCKKCYVEKEEEDFSIAYGNYRRPVCKDCINLAKRSDYAEDVEYRELKQKQNYESYRRHREKRIEYVREYSIINAVEIKQKRAARVWTEEARILARARNKRHKQKPLIRLKEALRSRVKEALRNNQKSGKTLELLGCSIVEWKTHLQSLFTGGMTWENYGRVWEIDHIRPCARFDLTNPEQQRQCFNWKNTQPLTVTANRSKADSCPLSS